MYTLITLMPRPIHILGNNNTNHTYFFQVKPTSHEKMSALLDYLERRPQKDFIHFRTALVFTNQEHVLNIFDDDNRPT